MKRGFAALLLTSIPLLAFAGKAEREYQKTKMTPAVTKAMAAYKTACGCALTINIDASVLKTTDYMAQAMKIANNISEGVATYCTDAESKKAMCAMKSLDIKKDKKTTFTFADSKGTAVTDGGSYVSWAMITREIDK
jgi:hypothetical protein